MSKVLNVKTLGTSKSKTAIALLLVLTLAAMLITSLPMSTAQTKTQTYGYVSSMPQTVQIGQSVLINAWVSPPPASYMGAPASVTFRDDHMFDLTKPDGTTDTVGPKSAYADGSIWFSYTPDQLGTWTVTLTWPGDEKYTSCVSPPYTFVVQNEPEPTWPAAELPTGYWARPVNAENREWSQLLGDWLMSGYDARASNFNPYSPAPNTAHILWTQETGLGGIISGEYGADAYRTTATPVVMGGRAYYSLSDGMHCVDLFTGQTLWTKVIPGGGWGGGQFFVTCPKDQDPGGAATHADIWVSLAGKVEVYDAFTGVLTKTMTDPGVGISKVHNGYFYLVAGGNFTKWDPYGGYEDVGFMGADFAHKTEWTVQLDPSLPTPSLYWDNIATDSLAQVAYNLDTGQLMWSKIRDASFYSNWAPAVADGKLFHADITMHWHAYDLYNNGNEVWVSEQSEYPWGAFWTYNSATAYGKVYGTSYDGHIYAFDVNTGAIVWKFYSGDAGTETPYGTWPFWGATSVADGKVYASTTEHTPTQPRHRGDRLYCLDDATGTEIWSIAGSFGAKVIADGMLLSGNEYDSILYCFGKGQTATTVSASPKVTAQGSTVLIEGTVMDQSPGQAGTPAVSDASMSAWMEYLHMQKPMPTQVSGVQVTLLAVDPNGNTQNIGTVTSDMSGLYSIMWTPPIEGKYTIIATFDGSQSYYGSYAETAIGVVSASASPSVSPSVVPPPEAEPSTDLYVIVAAAAVIIVVVAVAAVFLRKRK